MIGRLKDVVKDVKTKEYRITFTTSDIADMDALEGIDLDITIKKHRKKRSLDANAYAWVLMTKLANKLNTTKEEVYEELLRRTGFIEQDTIMAIPEDTDIEAYDGHWLYILSQDGWNTYVKLRGSSEFDSKEMSVFIDNIVEECKAQGGIETMTPEQLESMVRLWKKA